MPPDVFLMLASSSLTFVASLLFFVSPEPLPKPRIEEEVAFCAPPPRARPPPLPVAESIRVATTMGVMSLRPEGDSWVVTYEPNTLASETGATVHDLRWHGTAAVPRPSRGKWKQKPGQA